MKTTRSASIARKTNETAIELTLNIDGNGQAEFKTGVPFLEHMLDQIAKHGMIDLMVNAKGDIEIDAHHSVEDIGIALGQALKQALGDKSGVVRYGHAYVPLDEALSRVVIDFSGRPHLSFNAIMPAQTVGDFDTELVREFFQAVVNHSAMTCHIDTIRGFNTHHIIETIFKAFGRALRMAASADEKMQDKVPSTKGCL